MSTIRGFDAERFGSPMIVAGFIAGGWGSTEIVHHINQTGEYNPIHEQVLALRQDNQQIDTLIQEPHFKELSGKPQLKAHLESLQANNNQQIGTLVAQEPKQVISPTAELFIEAGSSLLVGIAVMAALVRHTRSKVRASKAKG